MGRFERANRGSGAWTGDDTDNLFPDDFSSEEAELAGELRELFAPEHEELPPLFTQTMLGDAHHTPVDTDLERRMAHRVRRQLNLPAAPLFERHHLWRTVLRDLPARVSRPVAASLSALVLLMTLTVVLATPSFAAGVQLIFGHTGALQVRSYPTHVGKSEATAQAGKVTSSTAPTRVEWLGETLRHYQFSQMLLSAPQSWSDGPVVELRYQLPHDQLMSAHSGSGVLDIREFRPAPTLAHVLQVVADGSATPVTVGFAPAAYVDGQWVHFGRNQDWQFGIKSELIFEQDGLVFWIVGDQRDGIGQEQLVDAALHLSTVSVAQITSPAPSLRLIGEQLVGKITNPAAGEVLALIHVGGSATSADVAFVSLANSSPGGMS
jgi:hypothetical protein